MESRVTIPPYDSTVFARLLSSPEIVVGTAILVLWVVMAAKAVAAQWGSMSMIEQLQQADRRLFAGK